ncbi:hypothetical protein [Arthrobacter monumenti]
MSDAIGMSLFGVILRLAVSVVFMIRKPLSRMGGRLVPTKQPDKLYRFQLRFAAVMSSIFFLVGLTMIVAGLIWEFGGS